MAMWLENESMRKRNGDRAEMILVLDMEWKENKPMPVLIEDRTVIRTIDQ